MASSQVQGKENTSGTGKRHKAEWNEKNSNIFLKVCVEQVRAGNNPHAHFNKIGWGNLVKNFNEQTGLSYEYKQMRNKWDLLKKDWQLWTKLKGKETGVGWDHVSQTITASEEWWQAKIKEYSEAAKFKGKGLRNLSEMEICFKDTVATGYNAWTPSEDQQQGEERLEANDGAYAPITDEHDDEELSMQDEEITSLSTQRPKRKRCRKDSKGGGVGRRMCEQFDQIIESLNAENTNAPSISVCLEMLKKLPGLEYESETHIIGIRLMKSKSNRETFVLMDDPILQFNWIKSHTLVDVSSR